MKIRIPSVMAVYALLLVSAVPVAYATADDVPLPVNAVSSQQPFIQTLQKAEAGDAKAQYDVARFYQTGSGVTQDAAKAIQWLTKAAEQGLVEAETSLGSAYDVGMGVPLSNRKAVYWWQKAARHGSDYALRCLGYAYIEGRGVAQSNLYAYVIWKQLPPDDAEAMAVLKALRKNLSAEEIARGDQMTLDGVFKGE